MSSPLDQASAALLPRAGLAALAGLRTHPDVAIILTEETAWVTWPAGLEEIWRPLLAVAGAVFFTCREGGWYRLGRHLPEFDVPPTGAAKSLDRLLFPAPVQAESPPTWSGTPVRLQLVRSDIVHPTRLLRTTLPLLSAWAETVTTFALESCRAAHCGERILLRGDRLPPLAEAERFWGNRVLVPLGYRPEPDLPESALRAAAEVSLGELLLLTDAGPEAIPEEAFQPLTRAGVRLANHPA